MKKENLIAEIIKIRKDLPKTFCPMPFTTLILEPDGKVGICRNKGNDFPIGNLSFQNIDEIWDIRNSPKAMQWRKEFLDGNPQICKDEVKHRKCNLDYHFNDLLPQAELKEKQTEKILRLTANLNGKCNMQCPFCTIWTLPNGNYTDKNFWEPAKISLFPFLKQIDMLSGEPFIQADTYKLIDIVSEINPECAWIFTTNMYWSLTQKVEEKLDKIEIKNISVSIDSFRKDVYARLRYPCKLEVTLKNLDGMLAYRKKRKAQARDFTLSFNFLVQKENYKELPEIFRFAKKNGMEFVAILLTIPSELSILNFNLEQRRAILDYYLESLTSEELFKINPVLMPLVEGMEKIDKVNYLSRLVSLKG